MNKDLAICLTLLVLAFPALAHHSQAEFDSSQMLEMSGEIVAAYWRNPHVNFTLKVVDQSGEEQHWEMETSAWNALSRRGLTRDMVESGDLVRVALNVSTKRQNHARLMNMLLEDGSEVRFAGNSRVWTEDVAGLNQAQPSPDPNATNSGSGLFQVWSIAGGRRVPLDRELPLRDEARAAQASWNPLTEDPLLNCIAPGMPPTMGNPYPMQFIQQGENIVIHLEEFDNKRLIHMSATTPASKSHLGHSVGRWEEGSLLIDTTNINYPYFNRVGVSQSDNVTTFERFTLSEDEARLDYELTITDPSTLTEPVTWSTYYEVRPSEEVKSYECIVERYVPQ